MTTLEKLEELIYKGFKETDIKILESSRETEEAMGGACKCANLRKLLAHGS